MYSEMTNKLSWLRCQNYRKCDRWVNHVGSIIILTVLIFSFWLVHPSISVSWTSVFTRHVILHPPFCRGHKKCAVTAWYFIEHGFCDLLKNVEISIARLSFWFWPPPSHLILFRIGFPTEKKPNKRLVIRFLVCPQAWFPLGSSATV